MNAKELINKGKSIAQSGYDKGNGLMDRVPALKSKRNKLIAWGALGVLVAAVMFGVFGGGSSDPFDVAKKTMVAAVEGDLKTLFENVYWPDDFREKISKMTEAEVESLEKELVEDYIGSYMESFSNCTEEQHQLLIDAFSTMKCESVKTSGDEAKVEAKVRMFGQEKSVTIKLKKYDGKWKLVMSQP